VAATYLEGVRGAIPLAAEQLELLLRLLAHQPGGVRRFLDLGCGDGALAVAILGQHPRAHATLLDFSEQMLEAARRRLAGQTRRARFVLADYGRAAWTTAVAGAAPFDAIVSGLSIHHQSDPGKRRVYRQVFELLRPGGLFLNLEHVSSATPWVEGVHDEHFVDALWRYSQHRGEASSRHEVKRRYYDRPDKAANRLAPVEQQCRWLRRLGFEHVDCFFKVFEVALFGGMKPENGRPVLRRETKQS
jgi:ubiquinone/menaquinone biosynthesis C-methylase UbiE